MILLLLISCTFAPFSYAEKVKRNGLENVPFSLKRDIKCLHDNYQNITTGANDTSQYEKAYLDCFPKSFDRFVLFFDYYGALYCQLNTICMHSYDEPLIKVRGGTEYEDIDYPALFIELLTKRKMYSEIFHIGVNGYYIAGDGVSNYSYLLEQFIESHIKISTQTLNKMTDRDLDSFWYFMFDGWTYNEPFPEKYLELEQYSKRVFTSAQRMFKLYKENYVHN